MSQTRIVCRVDLRALNNNVCCRIRNALQMNAVHAHVGQSESIPKSAETYFVVTARQQEPALWMKSYGPHPIVVPVLSVKQRMQIRTIARSGVTVTRLLCDPLPYKNVLSTAREKSGREYRFSFQYKMYQAFSQIFPRAVLRIGLYANALSLGGA
jgi:hypothetical protein